MIEKRRWWPYLGLLPCIMIAGLLVAQDQSQAANPGTAQATGSYQPKFAGDPARSNSEAAALGYMRVVLRAEHTYKQRHSKYTTTLTQLAGTGSFTKRMSLSMDRGDYTASFRVHKARNSDEQGFLLTMTPKHMDADHRSFYAEEDGVIRGDDQKAADADSPKVR
jgi:hypothetical protein